MQVINNGMHQKSFNIREGYSNPLQYSCLENPMDRGIWQATVLRVSESDMTEAT